MQKNTKFCIVLMYHYHCLDVSLGGNCNVIVNLNVNLNFDIRSLQNHGRYSLYNSCYVHFRKQDNKVILN